MEKYTFPLALHGDTLDMYDSKPAGARDFRLGLFESPHRGVKMKPGLEKLVLAFSHFSPQKSR